MANIDPDLLKTITAALGGLLIFVPAAVLLSAGVIMWRWNARQRREAERRLHDLAKHGRPPWWLP